MKDVKDMIWAYLHNELSPAERQRFEEALAGDRALHDALEECRVTHENLEHVGDQLLADELLKEWESEHPEFQEEPRSSKGRIIRFSLPLAAAAAVVLLLALPLQQGPVRWQKTVYGSGPQLRGGIETALEYSQTDLKQLNKKLQTAINTRISGWPNPPDGWTLQISLQELADGYIAVEVSGHPRHHSAQPKVWQATFHGLDKSQAGVEELAKRVAGDLEEQDRP